MRKRHWLTKLLSGALWAALPAAGWSQAPDMGYTPPINPDMPPAGALAAPTYTGMETAGWPQGATQWPYISPYYGPPVDQHKYENGFWFNEKTYGGREYFTYLGATLNEYANPKSDMVGDDNAPLFYQTTATTGTNNNTTGSQIIFPPKRWSDMKDRLSGGGFRGITGWFNPDETGVYFDGFWAEEGHAGYNTGQLIGLDDPAEIERRAPDVLRAYAGVPLFDGLSGTLLPIQRPNATAVNVPGGGTQPYDLYYRLGWQTQTYGAGAGYYANPMYEAGTLTMRPMAGMRYLNVRENATFDAADSGLGYTIDTLTGRPVVGSVVGPVDILESHLRSNTTAHLGGPEIGFRMDFGGDKLKIWTQSKLGIMANHSTREIEGYGIGRALVSSTTTTTTPQAMPTDPDLTRFHQQETTTSVSPTFEQSIFVRSPLLQFVPGVRKIRLFEEAQFQFGYTWLVAGGMYRPGTIIDWRGYPNYPSINNEKTTFWVNSWNLGVEWTY